MSSFVTAPLNWWGRRWCVLLAHQFEFFLELIGSYVIHFTQFVQLAQCETSFTQVAELYLTVVLRQILIGFGISVEKFV